MKKISLILPASVILYVSRHTLTIRKLLLTCLFLLSVFTNIFGAAKTFTGTGNFSDPNLWNGTTLPVAGDNLTINGTCTVDNSVTTDNVAYGTLVIGGTVAGVLNWIANGTNHLKVSNVSSSFAGSSLNMTNGGTFIITGTWTSTNLAFTQGTGTIEIQSSITLPAAYATYRSLTINGAGTTVTLGVGTTVSANLAVTNGILSVGAFSFAVTGTTTVTSTLTITSATGAKSFGSLVINGTFNNTAANVPFTVNNDFQNNGTYNGGTARVTFTGASNNVISGSAASTAFGGGITVNKGVSSANILDVQSVITLLAGGLTMTNGTFKLTSASTITPFTVNIMGAPYLVPTTCGIWCNGGTMSASANPWTVAGYLRVSAGTVNIGNAAGHFLQPGGGSAIITVDGGNLNVADRVSSPAVAWTFNMSSGTLTVPTVSSASANRPPFYLDQASCNFSMSGGTIIIRSMGGTAGQNLGYSNIAAGGTGFTGGTLQIGDGSTPVTQIMQITTNIPIYNLTVNSANATAQLLTYAPTITKDVMLSAGALDMNGLNMTVGGNWTQTSGFTFTPGTTSITLNGSTAAQTIGGTASTSFYNLTLTNTFVASPRYILGINATVQNTLTMTSGNINLATYTMTLGTAAATPGTLTYTAGWMYGGNFTRYFNTPVIAIGNVAGHFPVGSSADYRPMWIANAGSVLTTGGTITVAHTGVYPTTSTAVNFSDASWGNTVIFVSQSSWSVSTNSVTVGGAPFSVRVEGTGLGRVASVNDLNLCLSGSAVGSFAASGGSITNPQVNRTSLSLAQLNNGGTQTFYFGSKSASSPLPVELLYFEAQRTTAQYIDLTWSTASEHNNDFFTVERTTDGIHFEEIAKVKGAGNVDVIKNYAAVDVHPLYKNVYYRLKQTDFDGKFVYSALVAIRSDDISKKQFNLFPNPSNGTLFIRMPDSSDQTTICITDMMGKEVFSKVILPGMEPVLIGLELNDKLPTGMYTVIISSAGEILQKKLLIK
jgi:hypothetical protein